MSNYAEKLAYVRKRAKQEWDSCMHWRRVGAEENYKRDMKEYERWTRLESEIETKMIKEIEEEFGEKAHESRNFQGPYTESKK